MAYRILLADDSITIQKVVELILSEEDVEIKYANDGMEALECLHEVKPDIVLADIEMPKLDGYELCEKIKNDPTTASIPVILLAGAFEPFDEGRARAVGADDFLIKPFDSPDLLGKIEAIKPITQSETPIMENTPVMEENPAEANSYENEPITASEVTASLEEEVTSFEKELEEKSEEEMPLDPTRTVVEELTEEKKPATEPEDIEENIGKNIEKNIEDGIEEIIEEIIEESESVEADALDEDITINEDAWKTEEFSSSGFISNQQPMDGTEVILEAVEAGPDMLVDAEAEVVILSEEFVSEPESMQVIEQIREAIPALSREEVSSIVRESVVSILPDSDSINEALKSAISGAVPEKTEFDDYIKDIRETVPALSREEVSSIVQQSVASILPDSDSINEALKSAISEAVPEKTEFDDYIKDIREAVPALSREEVSSIVQQSVASILPDSDSINEALKSAISEAVPEKTEFDDYIKDIREAVPVLSREEVSSIVRESVASILPDSDSINEALKSAISGAVPEKSALDDYIRESVPALSKDEVSSIVQQSVASILPDSDSINEALKSAISGAVPEKTEFDDYIKDIREAVPALSKDEVSSLVQQSVASILPDSDSINEALKSAISGAVPEKTEFDDYIRDIREAVPALSKDDVSSIVQQSVASILPDSDSINEALKSAISGAVPEKTDIDEYLQKAISSRLPSKDDLEALIASSLDSDGIKAMVRETVNEKIGNDLLPAFKSMIEDILLDLVPKTTEQVTREVLQETLPAGITKTIEKVSLESMPGLAETLIAKVIDKIRSGS